MNVIEKIPANFEVPDGNEFLGRRDWDQGAESPNECRPECQPETDCELSSLYM